MPEIINVLKETARAAGSILKKHFACLKPSEVIQKSDIDWVTIADKESEQFIRESLKKAFPHIGFLGEESGGEDAARGKVFIADPLDGTVNFLRGIPNHGVSIGYVEDGVPQAGAIYLPQEDKLYWAVKGKGAWRDNTRIHVSATDKLHDAMLATGFSCVRDHLEPNNGPVFCDLLYKTTGLRWNGTAVQDYCRLAEGAYDGHWEFHILPWDYAAGILLVTEAGGTVTEFDGGPVRWKTGRILSTNGRLHQVLLEAIRKHL